MISRSDALLLLDKFCECRRVRCRVTIPYGGLWVEGKLRRVESIVFLESSSIVLEIRLADDAGFEYIEPREVFGRESLEGVVSGLGMTLPPRRDKLFFLELED